MPKQRDRLETHLWNAVEELRANSSLKSSEYSVPVLGLIFLLRAEPAKFKNLLDLPVKEDAGKAVDQVIEAIALNNKELELVLPTGYAQLGNEVVRKLLDIFHQIPAEAAKGDVLGEIYQYFLENFTRQERQQGGEFYTPLTLARLIAEIIEPDEGKLLDPACGAGAMFTQAIERLRQKGSEQVIAVYGQDKIEATVKMCQMNLAIHGIPGLSNIRQANSYYEDVHASVGAFDFVMANPPFNINGVDTDRLHLARDRYPFGVPSANGNYAWIQMFYSALNQKGRAGFIMPNTASDTRFGEQEVRRQLIETTCVDAVIAISPDIFPVACNLWFLDKRKIGQERANQILFVDARHIYYQITRSRQEFSEEQINFIRGIVQLHRGEQPFKSQELINLFPDGYRDVPGLCKAQTLSYIKTQQWSLNPLRYIKIATNELTEDFRFVDQLGKLRNELDVLNTQSKVLEDRISGKLTTLLGENR
jgi:type I restriction enzyme M protein